MCHHHFSIGLYTGPLQKNTQQHLITRTLPYRVVILFLPPFT